MDIRIPQLAEGVDSGTVVSILVSPGQQIAKDEAVMELETSKAIAPIPSNVAGTVKQILVKEGDQVNVGQAVITLGDAGASVPLVQDTPATPVVAASPATASASRAPYQYASPSGMAPPASPAIRKMARELGIDLTRVRGSEHGGRITADDVRAHVQQLQQSAATGVMAKPAADTDFSQWGSVRAEKFSTLRRAISEKMVDAWTTIPHVTQFHDIDVTDVMQLSKQHAPAFEQRGTRLTLTSFALRAVVQTLQQHPVFNTSLNEIAGELVWKEYYHIGLAVDTEQGLIVPVIRDVDQKNLLDISMAIQHVAEKARQRKIALEELHGGTFTISNQGSIGGAHFTPIINKPQVAILGLGRGRPMVVKGHERMMMPIGLSYDHRVIDGAKAARFVVDLANAFQQFTEEDAQLGS